MTDHTNKQPNPDLDLHASASKTGLSLKAKGAALFILLALDILGIIVVGYQVAQKDSDTKGLLPLLFLLFIAYQLIKTVDALLGIRTVYRDE